jgi:hypothetical protein
MRTDALLKVAAFPATPSDARLDKNGEGLFL